MQHCVRQHEGVPALLDKAACIALPAIADANPLVFPSSAPQVWQTVVESNLFSRLVQHVASFPMHPSLMQDVIRATTQVSNAIHALSYLCPHCVHASEPVLEVDALRLPLSAAVSP